MRLMISRGDDTVTHTTFGRLADSLDAGDVLVVNRSATLNAAFDAWLETDEGVGESIVLHLSTVLAGDRWVIELRRRGIEGTTPLRASHLLMLEALAGRDAVVRAYGEALRMRYLWHEFGDMHLLLCEPRAGAR